MTFFLGGQRAQYFQTGTGDFLEGGKVYTYAAGTDTLKDSYPTYADALAGTNAHTNPVILDSRGEATIVLKGATKVVLRDANNNLIWTTDNLDANSINVIDSNGNEVLKFVSVANAQNEITVTNAITGGSPSIAASGDDSNVNLKVSGKGTGTVTIGADSSGNISLARTSAVTGNFSVSGNSSLTGTLDVTGTSTVTSLTASGTITADKIVLSDFTESFNLIPAGFLAPFAMITAVNGWLVCDASAVSRTTYPALFAAIGTTWGAGDGSTTFNLPSLYGRTLVGSNGATDAVLGNSIGNLGGTRTHTLVTAEMPAHTHTHSLAGAAAGATAGGGVSALTTNIGSAGTTDNTGGNGAHNNIQPSAIVSYRIRAY